ncbi:MAG: hypothetical protein M5R36_27225 [Deltaproteobacteria bacterium]|nr:hypothetical protein [Deltaproteobacteria bacterium]
MAQVLDADRNRLGPTEHDAAGRNQEERDDDGADRVNVLERVHRDPPEHPRGGIAELVRRPRVGRFMKRDREHQRGQVYKNMEKDFGVHRGLQGLKKAGTVSKPRTDVSMAKLTGHAWFAVAWFV